MTQTGGFVLEFHTQEQAEQAFAMLRDFLAEQPLQEQSWQKNMEQSENRLWVNEQTPIDEEDYNGLFEALCCYLDEEMPNTVQSGYSTFSDEESGFSLRDNVVIDEEGLYVAAAADIDELADLLAEADFDEEEAAEYIRDLDF